MKKYDYVESLPMILAMIIFLVAKVLSQGSSMEKSGSLIMIMAGIAAISSFLIFWWANTIGSKISYYGKWQKRRLGIGTFLWSILFFAVFINTVFFKR